MNIIFYHRSEWESCEYVSSLKLSQNHRKKIRKSHVCVRNRQRSTKTYFLFFFQWLIAEDRLSKKGDLVIFMFFESLFESFDMLV